MRVEANEAGLPLPIRSREINQVRLIRRFVAATTEVGIDASPVIKVPDLTSRHRGSMHRVSGYSAVGAALPRGFAGGLINTASSIVKDHNVAV